MLTHKQLIRAVCEKFDEKDAHWIDGPVQIGDYTVHEVWTQDKGSPHHYHAHHTAEWGDELEILQDFLGFTNWIQKRVNEAAVHDVWERRLRLMVGTTVVLSGLALLIYLVVWEPQQSEVIKYLLSVIVAAAAGYVFGSKTQRGERAATLT